MEDGVWRTIAGRRVFIKKGQSLTDAMRESGKFEKYNADVEINRIMQVIEQQNTLEKELQQITDETFNKLSEEELNDMMFYTTDGYFDINDYISGKYDLERGEEIIDNINNSISKFNYDKEFTVYSGTSKYHYRNYEKNDIIDNNRFLSSSVNLNIAEAFAESEEHGLIMKINVKPKNKGMYIGTSSSMFSESEYLFSNNQKYKVLNRDKIKINGKTFEMLEVEANE